MKKIIWKFDIDIVDKPVATMPEGSEILSAQSQDNDIKIWALVNPANKPVDRFFEIFGTGHPIHFDMGIERKFIATVQSRGGVWHIFERLD